MRHEVIHNVVTIDARNVDGMTIRVDGNREVREVQIVFPAVEIELPDSLFAGLSDRMAEFARGEIRNALYDASMADTIIRASKPHTKRD
jgi:hypothetical protein